MNSFVRNKIIKDNLILFGIGIACIIGGFIINAVIYEFGWITALMAVPLIGIGLFFNSLFRMVYWPSNNIYKVWKAYGGTDSIINEIQEAINSKKKDFESKGIIISKGWIVQPKKFIFVKPHDVNWVYLSKQGLEGIKIHQTIKIFTSIGVSFEIRCKSLPIGSKAQDGTITGDVAACMHALKHFCKNTIFGFSPELKVIWKNSPKNFIDKVRTLANEHR